jgi:hypothetical protein
MATEIFSQTNYPILYDFDYRGGLDTKGAMREVWNEQALNNSIKMWLASYGNEIIRRPGSGGYFTALVMTPMSQVDVDNVISTIRLGLVADFRPFLKINRLEVRPDYKNKIWEVYLEVYSPDLGIYTEVSEKIKNQV